MFQQFAQPPSMCYAQNKDSNSNYKLPKITEKNTCVHSNIMSDKKNYIRNI